VLIGWPPSDGTQQLNNLHFHYGYFVSSSARLCLVDNDFKSNFGLFARVIAKDYANWNHYDGGKEKGGENMFLLFFRTFDSYEGHSVFLFISFLFFFIFFYFFFCFCFFFCFSIKVVLVMVEVIINLPLLRFCFFLLCNLFLYVFFFDFYLNV
jgi:hypothetical protein